MKIGTRLSLMLNNHRTPVFFRKNFRFFLPLMIVASAKFVGALLLYYSMSLGSVDSYWMTVNWDTRGQNAILQSIAVQGFRWPYLFLGWDSAWYLSIITKGYIFSDQSFAFFPSLPLFSWLLNLIMKNSVYALISVSLVSGILWIPLFQLTAETYMDKSNALKTTLFYTLFPYVFLFTTVTYTEGLFLFSTLGSWYFFRKRRLFIAMLFASIAAISRPPGLLIILPIIIEMLRTREYPKCHVNLRQLIWLSIPFQAIFAWLLYCKISLNDWFAFSNRSEFNGLYSFTALIFNFLTSNGINALYQKLFNDIQAWPFSLAWVIFLLVSPFMIYAVTKIDKTLTIYTIAYFLGILVGGGLESIPRFVSFIFPMWLAPALKLFQLRQSKLFYLLIYLTFYVCDLLLWLSFLNGTFVA